MLQFIVVFIVVCELCGTHASIQKIVKMTNLVAFCCRVLFCIVLQCIVLHCSHECFVLQC